MGHTATFDVYWVQETVSGGTPVGHLDGTIEVETEPLKSYTVLGQGDEKLMGFVLEWFTGSAEARELRFIDPRSGKTWQGEFLFGPGSVDLVGEADGHVTFVSTGEIREA